MKPKEIRFKGASKLYGDASKARDFFEGSNFTEDSFAGASEGARAAEILKLKERAKDVGKLKAHASELRKVEYIPRPPATGEVFYPVTAVDFRALDGATYNRNVFGTVIDANGLESPAVLNNGHIVCEVNPQYEPRLDVMNDAIIIHKWKLPRVNTTTALLFAFHRTRDNPEAREYYFWRLCDELWNHSELPEMMVVRNPFADKIVKVITANKYTAIGGAASTGKSHILAVWAILNFLCAPNNTQILITSTTMREARKRIWGSVISLLSVLDGMDGMYKIRDSIGNVSFVNSKGVLLEKFGLTLVAAEKRKAKEAVGKFIGIKAKYVMVVGDELSEISESILHAGLTNLSKNEQFSMHGLSNPNLKLSPDAFGVWSEPEGGWDSVDALEDMCWKTKWGGFYLRLDGLDSPNILAGKVIYSYLLTIAQRDEDIKILGEGSRGYMRMVRAVFFEGSEDDTVYSLQELERAGVRKQGVEWHSAPTPVAGLDPAFTNGGDKTTMSIGLVGLNMQGQMMFELVKQFDLYDDAKNVSVPRTYQIASQVKEAMTKYGISNGNLAVDSTGAGAPFCDVLEGEGVRGLQRVTFAGKPTDRRVAVNSKLTGVDVYVNRVSELWFVGKEFARCKQLRGFTDDIISELTSRMYVTKKEGSLKVRLESKVEYKSRIGHSPDNTDSAFLALDAARNVFGFAPMEPVGENEANKFKFGKRKSIKALNRAMVNENATLPS